MGRIDIDAAVDCAGVVLDWWHEAKDRARVAETEIDRLREVLAAEIDANRDMSLLNYRLTVIAARAGAWITVDDVWVYGNDAVRFADGHSDLVFSADSIRHGERRFYRSGPRCEECGELHRVAVDGRLFCKCHA